MGEILWKVCAAAIVCVVAGLIVKQVRGDFSALLRIGGCVLIFGFLIPRVWEGMSEALFWLEESGAERYAQVMLRCLGIALLSRICTDICRDCGEGSVASGVELAGKLAILMLCVPLIEEMIGYATEILQWE